MITPRVTFGSGLCQPDIARSGLFSRSPAWARGRQSRLVAVLLLAAIAELALARLDLAGQGAPQNTGAAPGEHQAPVSGAQAGAISTPAELIAHYQQRLKADPGDTDALEGLARAEAELKNFPAAISAYRRVLEARRHDRAAQIQLARLLGWNQQYEESIRAFRAVLDEAPADREALEGLANVQVWSKKLEDAAVTYGQLASRYPDDHHYLFEAARLETDSHQYAAARERLTSLLAVESGNLDARLLLAQLELRQGQYPSALRQFEGVLAERPADVDALMGAARAHYYSGDLERAYVEASKLVEQQPQNFDALFLLAHIERARGHRHRARLLLSRADRVAPHNPEVKELREKLWNESSTVLHLTAGYTREIGSPAGPNVPAELIEEDLRSFSFGSRLDFTALPRSTSSFSFYSLPVQMPSGFFGGAAAPLQFLYQQTTRVFSKLTLRGGVGLEHFGPGVPVNLPKGAGPQPGATTTAIGFGGGTFVLSPRWSFDLIWTRSGITYTPLSTRLGVISNRTEGGATVTFDPRTNLQLTYYRERLTTEPYDHLVSPAVPTGSQALTVETADYENGSGGTLTFNHRFVDREGLAVEAGFSALLLGYDGPRRGVYLGFFTPSFYQRELATGRLSGQFTKRLGYDISAGFGMQQVEQGEPIKRALNLSPGFTFKLTPFLSGNIGYTYYDSAQSLGIVQGNGVHLGIDWRF
jgi:cytochrome c-type biogenesis protein CcmH/NrfG